MRKAYLVLVPRLHSICLLLHIVILSFPMTADSCCLCVMSLSTPLFIYLDLFAHHVASFHNTPSSSSSFFPPPESTKYQRKRQTGSFLNLSKVPAEQKKSDPSNQPNNQPTLQFGYHGKSSIHKTRKRKCPVLRPTTKLWESQTRGTRTSHSPRLSRYLDHRESINRSRNTHVGGTAGVDGGREGEEGDRRVHGWKSSNGRRRV